MKIIIDIEAIGKIILYAFIICFACKMIIYFTESKFVYKSIETAQKFIFPPKDNKPTKLNYFSWFILLPSAWFLFLFAVVYISNK